MSYTAQKKYTQHFRKAWLSDIVFKDWLLEVAGKNTKAQCRFCGCYVDAKRYSLIHHAKSKKHQLATETFSSLDQQELITDACRHREATAEDKERPDGHSAKPDPGCVMYMESKDPITFELDESLNENDQDYGAETIQIAEDEVIKNSARFTKQRMTGQESIAASAESAQNNKILDAALGFFNIVSRHSSPATEDDDDEVFGRYLARELKNIKSEKLKKQMKRKILNMIWNMDPEKEVVSVPFPIFVTADTSLPLRGKKKDQS